MDIRRLIMTVIALALLGLVIVYGQRIAANLTARAGV